MSFQILLELLSATFPCATRLKSPNPVRHPLVPEKKSGRKESRARHICANHVLFSISQHNKHFYSILVRKVVSQIGLNLALTTFDAACKTFLGFPIFGGYNLVDVFRLR